MTKNNAINDAMPTPFTIGATSVTSTGTQLNYLSGVTIGASGNIMTSNSSVMISSAPNVAGSNQLISTQTASSSATINFTGLTSAYGYYYVVYWGVLPGTSTAQLGVRVSTDNGSTYSTTGYYYAATQQSTLPQTTTQSAANGTLYSIAGTAANNSPNTGAGILKIINPSQSSSYHQLSNKIVYVAPDGTVQTVIGACVWTSATAINAFQFIYGVGGGNIASGTFKLYGVLA